MPREKIRASSVFFSNSLPPARRPSLGGEAAMSLIFDSLSCFNRFHWVKDWEEKRHPLTSSDDRPAVIYMELEIKALSITVEEKQLVNFLKIVLLVGYSFLDVVFTVLVEKSGDKLRASSVSFGSSLPLAWRPSLGGEAAMSLIFDSLLCLNRFHWVKDWEEKRHPLTSSNDRSAVIYMELDKSGELQC
ncbi:hypothetical protein CDAR_465511 [Caerostris darwini]|uniref:Uncharacterized protein n=1 Tax=Caerostris darwini TaxID=1538125 RepID=A0AAV4S9S2_9ARAC|nr:hypothetical protein CDAR_465511 [Caerostris darwini]